MTCDACGQELQLGDWPFCPHGHKGSYTNFRDEIVGGVTVENYGPQELTFYSHSERRRYMAEHGLRERERFAPMPGTDKDPQGIPNPKGYMDPQTLENARILLSRNGKGPVQEEPPLEFASTSGGHLADADAIAVQTNTDPKRLSRIHRRTS
jgi:hypothetical protein